MKNIEFSNAVGKNAIKSNKEYKESNSWLQRAKKFDHTLRLSNSYQSASETIFVECKLNPRKENYVNQNVLLANLLHAKSRYPLRVSLSPNRWKRTRYTRAGASTINIIKSLNELGYIKMRIGFNDRKNSGNSRDTRIWPTEKLLEYFPRLDNGIIKHPVELVELRNDEGDLLTYTDNRITKGIRKTLEKVNRVNESAQIRYLNYDLNSYLVAIFKNDFNTYGRLHTKGYRHIQGCSQSERNEITINGDKVIELDYSGLHPTLLYAIEGYQIWNDPYRVVDDRPEVRPFLKQILLCMLNAESFTQAEKASNYWLFKNHSEQKDLREVGITKAGPLMNKFIDAHQKISHHFLNGKSTGLKVMNLDSKIALRVIDHFANKGVPILSIHDSFVVQSEYKKELKSVMQKAYSIYTDGFRIKIK